MFGTTMMLTIGQALDRAQNEGSTIRLHVFGEWITGRVINTDSQSVMVLDNNGDTCVLRMDAITCVRIPAGERAQQVPLQPNETPVRA